MKERVYEGRKERKDNNRLVCPTVETVAGFPAFLLPNRESPLVPVHAAQCGKRRLPAGRSALLREKKA